MDWSSIFKDSLTIAFSFCGLFIAQQGLQTWKEQLKGTKEMEAVYNLHFSLLKLREAIKYVRNPFVPVTESNKALELLKEKRPEKNDLELTDTANSYVYELRWEKITAAYAEVDSHLLAIEVLWGSEILELMKAVHSKVNELNSALRQNFNPDQRIISPQEIHKIIYNQNLDGDDEFGRRIAESVETITTYLKSMVR